MKTINDLRNLLEDGEKIAVFGHTESYSEYYMLATDSDNIHSFLEMTLHRMLEAGWTQEDIHCVLGAYIPSSEEMNELEEFNEYESIDLCYVLPGLITCFRLLPNMNEIKDMWLEFGDVPMNPETERLESPWKQFKPGTHREEVWHWFEKELHINVAKDLMYVFS